MMRRPPDPGRRAGLRLIGATLLAWPLHAPLQTWAAVPPAAAPRRWVAAWNSPDGHRIGLLRLDDGHWRIEDELPVPTRAHGLLVLPDASVIAVARRPGDWLLRWQPLRRTAARVIWAAPQRQFSGHAVLHPDGRHLLVTETDTEAADGFGTGLVSLRHLDSLAVEAEWLSSGRDPHQLLPDPDGSWLWVANGGIASRPETGRTRYAELPMDASVAALDLRSGRVEQRWQLPDARLSLRHLAWHAPSATLGIAMQAEHADAAQRLQAPVLALLQPLAGQRLAAADALRSVPGEAPMHGYGGDICATPEGFAISSPRSGRVGFWRADGGWQGSAALPQVCALGTDLQQPGALMAAGQLTAARLVPPQTGSDAAESLLSQPLPVTPDNHWMPWTPV